MNGYTTVYVQIGTHDGQMDKYWTHEYGIEVWMNGQTDGCMDG